MYFERLIGTEIHGEQVEEGYFRSSILYDPRGKVLGGVRVYCYFRSLLAHCLTGCGLAKWELLSLADQELVDWETQWYHFVSVEDRTRWDP